MKTNTKTNTKTAKTAARPSAVKSVKTAKGHTLAAVKGWKLVKIAECVREDATAAKPKPEAVKATTKQPKTLEAAIKERAAKIGIDTKRVIVAPVPAKEVKAAAVALAKPKDVVKAEAEPKEPSAKDRAAAKVARPAQKPPEESKQSETFAAMIERHFKEREAVAPFAAKPAPDMVATPSGFVPRSKIAAVVAMKDRHAREHHDFIMRRASEAFAWALPLFNGDPRAALFYLGITFHDDRGDGCVHVPLFRRKKAIFEAWTRCASVKGYRAAAEIVKAA